MAAATITGVNVEERLDRIEMLLGEMARELAAQRAGRERWSELAADATPIARQALASVGETLDESGITLEQLSSFLVSLATAMPMLQNLLDQLESLAELTGTVSSYLPEATTAITNRMTDLDERGYFRFVGAGAGVVDRVVTSFSEEDVVALGDNIVLILNTVKEMTQPEVMSMLQRTFESVQEEEAQFEKTPPGALALLKEMREPDVRRGLNKVIHMLRSVGEEPAAELEGQKE